MTKILVDKAVIEQALNALDSLVVRNRLKATEYEVRSNALRAALENQFNPDWDRVEALKECLREHMAEIQRLRAALEQPQVEQEPAIYPEEAFDMGLEAIPYYTHPQPPRQPLTNEQIKNLIPDGDAWKYEVGFTEATEFARAIEAAHGIGE